MTPSNKFANSARDSLNDSSRAVSRVEVEAVLARREAVLYAASRAAQRFLSGNWRDTISDLLGDLGRGADVSRVFLFHNRLNADRQMRHFQIYEWCAADIEPHIDDTALQDFVLAEIGLERWNGELASDRIVQGVTSQLPPGERPVLEMRETRSIVVVPVTVSGQWWGCLGFEECRRDRVWEAIEVETLRLTADLTAAAIARELSDAAWRQLESETSALFEAIRDPAFVLDTKGVYRKVFSDDERFPTQPQTALIGRNLTDVFSAPVATQFQDAIDQVTRTGEVLRIHYPMKIQDEELWFSATISPLKDGNVLWIARDTTQAHREREEIKQREELFRLLTENSSDCISTHSIDGRMTYVTPMVERIYGYKPEELIGQNIFKQIHPDHLETLAQTVQRLLANPGASETSAYQVMHKAGHYVWVESTGHVVVRDNGEFELHSVTRDITERRAHEDALRRAEEKYRSIFENAAEGIFQTTSDGHYLDANHSLARIYGYGSVAELRATFSDIAGQLYANPNRRAEFVALMEEAGEVSNFESQIRCKDGALIWISENARAVRNADGAIIHYEGTVEDITAKRAGQERLRHDALHDQLTGLSNRALFMDRLERSFARLKRHPNALFAILFLDFDHFKNINDSLGHLAGDQILQEIARRLEECLRPGDTVSRFGGDEFALLLEEVKDLADAIYVAERVQNALRQPFQLSTQQVFSSASIGIALGHGGYERAEDLLRDADMAMYHAKQRGKARHEVFDAEMHTSAVALLQLETDLRWAIERDEFRLHYQPIVELNGGTIVGFEALIRWQHPQRGLVAPAEFIPIAEETGAIVAMGRWVLRQACAQLARWQAEVGAQTPLSMSVNLSNKQFSQPDLTEIIETTLRKTGVAPANLKLEITESALMENAQTVTNRLLELRKLGIKLGLDDFGTGYSSLSYLHRFPLDTLKIDRSFVARLLEEGENREIVRTIVTLGKNLGMDVVAEGIEEARQLDDLRGLNCPHGQGYLFARPLPADEATHILREGLR